jgi:hypothetical protein
MKFEVDSYNIMCSQIISIALNTIYNGHVIVMLPCVVIMPLSGFQFYKVSEPNSILMLI